MKVRSYKCLMILLSKMKVYLEFEMIYFCFFMIFFHFYFIDQINQHLILYLVTFLRTFFKLQESYYVNFYDLMFDFYSLNDLLFNFSNLIFLDLKLNFVFLIYFNNWNYLNLVQKLLVLKNWDFDYWSDVKILSFDYLILKGNNLNVKNFC